MKLIDSFVPPLSSPDSITVVLESFSIDLRINGEGAGAANKRQKGQTSGELHLALFRATQVQSALCMCVCVNTSDVFRGVSLPQKTYARAWWGSGGNILWSQIVRKSTTSTSTTVSIGSPGHVGYTFVLQYYSLSMVLCIWP